MWSMHEIYSENTVGIDFSIHARNVLRNTVWVSHRPVFYLVSEQCCRREGRSEKGCCKISVKIFGEREQCTRAMVTHLGILQCRVPCQFDWDGKKENFKKLKTRSTLFSSCAQWLEWEHWQRTIPPLMNNQRATISESLTVKLLLGFF